MSRKCVKCEKDKPEKEFYIRSESGNYRMECKSCMAIKKKTLRKQYIEQNANVEKSKNINVTCTVCHATKPQTDFPVYRGNKKGFYSWCLECARKKDRERKKPLKVYKETDTKKCTQCKQVQLVLNEFHVKKGTRDGYSNICKTCKKAYMDKNAKQRYLHKKHKLATNIQFKMAENMRARIRAILKTKRMVKPNTEKLIGCTLDKFVSHIERLLYDDLELENYGEKWHLDHVIPCNRFDLTDIKQVLACCHYTNLQPLSIKHNLQKSDSLDWTHPVTKGSPTFLRLVLSGYLK